MEKKAKQILMDRHILCFGDAPNFFIQTPGRIEWFGGYSALHGGHRLSSAINRYLYASVSYHDQLTLRIISNQFPAITVALVDGLDHGQDHPSTKMVKVLLRLAKQKGMRFKQGLNVFMASELPSTFHLGASTAFIVTILEILLSQQTKNETLSIEEKHAWIHQAEVAGAFDYMMHDDALAMVQGGTILLPLASQPIDQFQVTQQALSNHRIFLLQIKHQGTPPWMWMKHIIDQMNIVAHHYQQNQLLTVDPLTFQFDVNALTRMYGVKTVNKVHYFFQEMQRAKQAFLALEKNDTEAFVRIFQSMQRTDKQWLEHHITPTQESTRIAATLTWLDHHMPSLAYRLHGLGFQGPVLLLIPKDDSQLYAQLKHQFYEENLLELKLVRHGTRSIRS